MKDTDVSKSKTKRILKDILKVATPIAVSILLILWLLHKVNIRKMDELISHDCDFFWVVLMMIVSIFSHVIRGIRWGIQLRGAGLRRMPVMVESVSIFGAYALNLLVPLLGEGWRCVYMSKREQASLSTVVGTDIGDRFSDALAIIALTLLAFVVAKDKLVQFIGHYALGQRLLHIISNPWLWVIIIAVIGIAILICFIFRKHKFVKRILQSMAKIWEGFKILFTMKHKTEYIILTIGIWTCYYLETYLCFFAFPFTKALITERGTFYGLIPGLVAFVFGSISIAIPSNGGLGPWNVAVMFSLSLYGISTTQGAAYSMVLWGFKSAMLVALGIFSAAYIMTHKNKNSGNVTVSGKTEPVAASSVSEAKGSQ